MGKIFGVFYPFYKMVLYGFGFSLYVKVKKKLILNKYSLYHIKNKYMAHPILRIWTSGFVQIHSRFFYGTEQVLVREIKKSDREIERWFFWVSFFFF